jgi:hypothetical protein
MKKYKLQSHSERSLLTNKPFLKTGTLVYVDLNEGNLIRGEVPLDGLHKGDFYIPKTKMAGNLHPAIILDLDILENYYYVLFEDSRYWIRVAAVSAATPDAHTSSA